MRSAKSQGVTLRGLNVTLVSVCANKIDIQKRKNDEYVFLVTWKGETQNYIYIYGQMKTG